MPVFLSLAALAAMTAYSFWYGFAAWARNRAIEDTPTSRVRSAAQGYVELEGRGILTPNSNSKAPLSGMPATWWSYKIEERRFLGRSRLWTTVDSGVSETPFLLDDGSGQCLIDPRGAEVFPGAKDVWYGSCDWPDVRIPNGIGISGRIADLFVTNKYRYTEKRLMPREHIYAIGSFRSMGGISTDDPEARFAELLRSWKNDQPALLARFDLNHDGTLSSREWELARASARKEISDGPVQTAPSGLNVLAHPGDGRPFLLAASDGESLARRFRGRAAASIAAFVVLGAALTWMLTHL